jgi:hypothetical protein
MVQGTDRYGIIPDAKLRVCLHRGRLGGNAADLSMRDKAYLFDVKTIAAGGPTYHARYRSPRTAAASPPVIARGNGGITVAGGAVAERARIVPGEYEAAARGLDLRLHGIEAPAVGPALTLLRTYPPARALVFGAYGEASEDVHTLLRVASERAADGQWARLGARSRANAVGYFASIFRRRWGITAVREYARLRIERLGFVGAWGGARAALVAAPVAEPVSSVFSASAFQAGVWAH